MQDFTLKESVKDSIFAFGSFISKPDVLNDMSRLKRGIEQMTSLDISTTNGILKPAYFMVLAEAHRNCITISPNGFVGYNNESIVMHIQYLRKALYTSCLYPDFENIQLINLGNALNQLKRYSESIKCWKQVLEQKNYSTEAVIGVVLYSLGACICEMASLLPTVSLAKSFISIGKMYLEQALVCKNINLKLRPQIQNVLIQVRNKEKLFPRYVRETTLDKTLDKKATLSEQTIWYLNNVLYLNPLNDLSIGSDSASDIIDIAFIKEDHLLVSGYNELKEQYIYSREMLYDANIKKDDDKLKVSFRLAYSILDKLAGLINHYFNLGYNNAILSYNKIWFTKKSNKKHVADSLASTENPYLVALYWISRDIFLDGEESSDPEASDIAKCRNYIEHRFIEIVEGEAFDEKFSNSQLSIGRSLLFNKSLKLHCLVRNALLYFYLAVRWSFLNEHADISIAS